MKVALYIRTMLYIIMVNSIFVSLAQNNPNENVSSFGEALSSW